MMPPHRCPAWFVLSTPRGKSQGESTRN